MSCLACGSDNAPASKFCAECGASLAKACQACGAPTRPASKFCNECGASLPAALSTDSAGAAPQATTPGTAERRLVSVLFADLVGFTSLSEKRDAEEVRDLLTEYFDTCRALVGRYGGVVEKFIGDAVMAVWGAPVAHEDDFERAVRAAIDLVDAVSTLGVERGLRGLQARAGVLTGDAAVTIGAQAQGMVAGDMVNTASRIQSAAEPGTVLVGEATKQLTEAAIVYADAGRHALKGKSEPVQLWQAVRVVALVGGALKSEGLEAPFVGRDRELRLIKDQFHACATDRKAQLLSLSGVAGIGKSRLTWEFFKYIDGLADEVFWHRGRCLAYGDGVTYWALAEMIRSRAGIADGEDRETASAKLRASLDEHVLDEEERRWIEPRLAQLLGLEDAATQEREELFSAWRSFFERLAQVRPVVLLFEDMQWADSSLLEFIEYLLEWTRGQPLFVLTAGRPELLDRHPTWGAGKRNFTSVFLEPLSQPGMEQLLDGLLPGLPDEVRERVLQRAEGVPLYAVETVRMLLDQGLVTRAGSVYRVSGTLVDLDVPPSLHALIAARLDGLDPDERRAVQDAAVLGKTFTIGALVAVSGEDPREVEPILTELVHKEVLSLQGDPRSPERGQFGFLQELVRRVAYETVSKRDRKLKHLAVAEWLGADGARDEADVVEVIASHYLEAYNLAPADFDADEIRHRAAEVLSRAGERCASLAANREAERYFSKAAELAGPSVRQAELLERAGQAAWGDGRADAAMAHLEASLALFDARDQRRAAARVSARLGEVEAYRHQAAKAVARMESAFHVLAADARDADLAALAVMLARATQFTDEDASLRWLREALDLAELLQLPELVSQALNTRGVVAINQGHHEEARALLSHALTLALTNDLAAPALRGYMNLAEVLTQRDEDVDAVDLLRKARVLAARTGHRFWERFATAQLAYELVQLGRWDEADEVHRSIEDETLTGGTFESLSLLGSAEMYVHRGEPERLGRLVAAFSSAPESNDWQERAAYFAGRALWLRTMGDDAEALASADRAIAEFDPKGFGHQDFKAAVPQALEAAFALGNLDRVEALVDMVDRAPPGDRPASLSAQVARFRARLAGARGDADVADAQFRAAADGFTSVAMPFRLAVVQLEHAEWLASQSRSAEAAALLAGAESVFERLRAKPWLERAQRVSRERHPVLVPDA